jgi:hypothetical protein
MSPLIQRVWAGGISVAVSSLLTAAILSRFQNDWDSPLRFLVLLINALAGTVLVAFRSYPFAILVFVIQWFFIGYFIMWVIQRFKRDDERST